MILHQYHFIMYITICALDTIASLRQQQHDLRSSDTILLHCWYLDSGPPLQVMMSFGLTLQFMLAASTCSCMSYCLP